jgi:hypothetical protein
MTTNIDDTEHDLSKVLKKIQALLAKANDAATTSAESDTYRAKAEEMMMRYRVEEQHLRDIGQAPGIAPMATIITVAPVSSPYRLTYVDIMRSCLAHCGVRAIFKGARVEDIHVYVAEVVGFESDIRFCELLFTSAAMVFGEKMEPKYNPALSDEDNVYAMRSAGLERPRIAEIMWGAPVTDGAAARRATALYKRACEARGESPTVAGKGFSAKQFRESYAEQFSTTLQTRLWRARQSNGESGALVLANRKGEVDEAFYQRYPHMRPVPVQEEQVPTKPLTDAQLRKLYRRLAKDAERDSTPAAVRGRAAGESAANMVDIGATSSKGISNE